MISGKVYVLLFHLIIATNGSTTVNNTAVRSASDSLILMKILQSVDAATSDEHLFDVTLKLLNSLCMCMHETLKDNERKKSFHGDTNSLQIDDESQESDGKVLDLYTKIYNNTCLNLKLELATKLNRMHDTLLGHDNFMKNSNCGKKMDITTEKVVQMSTNMLPIIQSDVNSKLKQLLFETLIQTQSYHKYSIKRYNLFQKSKLPSTLDNSRHSIIVIITLRSNKNNINKSNEDSPTISDKELNETLYTKSPVDIDIIDTKYGSDVKESTENMKMTIASECNLQSIYFFLTETEKRNFTKVFKVLKRKGMIKIYIDVRTMRHHGDYSRICCGDRGKTMCNIDFIRDDDVSEEETKIQNKTKAPSLMDTISRIKTLVSMYDENVKQNKITTSGIGEINTYSTIRNQELTEQIKQESITDENKQKIKDNMMLLNPFLPSDYKKLSAAFDKTLNKSGTQMMSNNNLLSKNSKRQDERSDVPSVSATTNNKLETITDSYYNENKILTLENTTHNYYDYTKPLNMIDSTNNLLSRGILDISAGNEQVYETNTIDYNDAFTTSPIVENVLKKDIYVRNPTTKLSNLTEENTTSMSTPYDVLQSVNTPLMAKITKINKSGMTSQPTLNTDPKITLTEDLQSSSSSTRKYTRIFLEISSKQTAEVKNPVIQENKSGPIFTPSLNDNERNSDKLNSNNQEDTTKLSDKNIFHKSEKPYSTDLQIPREHFDKNKNLSSFENNVELSPPTQNFQTTSYQNSTLIADKTNENKEEVNMYAPIASENNAVHAISAIIEIKNASKQKENNINKYTTFHLLQPIGNKSTTRQDISNSVARDISSSTSLKETKTFAVSTENKITTKDTSFQEVTNERYETNVASNKPSSNKQFILRENEEDLIEEDKKNTDLTTNVMLQKTPEQNVDQYLLKQKPLDLTAPVGSDSYDKSIKLKGTQNLDNKSSWVGRNEEIKTSAKQKYKDTITNFVMTGKPTEQSLQTPIFKYKKWVKTKNNSEQNSTIKYDLDMILMSTYNTPEDFVKTNDQRSHSTAANTENLQDLLNSITVWYNTNLSTTAIENNAVFTTPIQREIEVNKEKLYSNDQPITKVITNKQLPEIRMPITYFLNKNNNLILTTTNALTSDNYFATDKQQTKKEMTKTRSYPNINSITLTPKDNNIVLERPIQQEFNTVVYPKTNFVTANDIKTTEKNIFAKNNQEKYKAPYFSADMKQIISTDFYLPSSLESNHNGNIETKLESQNNLEDKNEKNTLPSSKRKEEIAFFKVNKVNLEKDIQPASQTISYLDAPNRDRMQNKTTNQAEIEQNYIKFTLPENSKINKNNNRVKLETQTPLSFENTFADKETNHKSLYNEIEMITKNEHETKQPKDTLIFYGLNNKNSKKDISPLQDYLQNNVDTGAKVNESAVTDNKDQTINYNITTYRNIDTTYLDETIGLISTERDITDQTKTSYNRYELHNVSNADSFNRFKGQTDDVKENTFRDKTTTSNIETYTNIQKLNEIITNINKDNYVTKNSFTKPAKNTIDAHNIVITNEAYPPSNNFRVKDTISFPLPSYETDIPSTKVYVNDIEFKDNNKSSFEYVTKTGNSRENHRNITVRHHNNILPNITTNNLNQIYSSVISPTKQQMKRLVSRENTRNDKNLVTIPEHYRQLEEYDEVGLDKNTELQVLDTDTFSFVEYNNVNFIQTKTNKEVVTAVTQTLTATEQQNVIRPTLAVTNLIPTVTNTPVLSNTLSNKITPGISLANIDEPIPKELSSTTAYTITVPEIKVKSNINTEMYLDTVESLTSQNQIVPTDMTSLSNESNGTLEKPEFLKERTISQETNELANSSSKKTLDFDTTVSLSNHKKLTSVISNIKDNNTEIDKDNIVNSTAFTDEEIMSTMDTTSQQSQDAVENKNSEDIIIISTATYSNNSFTTEVVQNIAEIASKVNTIIQTSVSSNHSNGNDNERFDKLFPDSPTMQLHFYGELRNDTEDSSFKANTIPKKQSISSNQIKKFTKINLTSFPEYTPKDRPEYKNPTFLTETVSEKERYTIITTQPDELRNYSTEISTKSAGITVSPSVIVQLTEGNGPSMEQSTERAEVASQQFNHLDKPGNELSAVTPSLKEYENIVTITNKLTDSTNEDDDDTQNNKLTIVENTTKCNILENIQNILRTPVANINFENVSYTTFSSVDDTSKSGLTENTNFVATNKLNDIKSESKNINQVMKPQSNYDFSDVYTDKNILETVSATTSSTELKESNKIDRFITEPMTTEALTTIVSTKLLNKFNGTIILTTYKPQLLGKDTITDGNNNLTTENNANEVISTTDNTVISNLKDKNNEHRESGKKFTNLMPINQFDDKYFATTDATIDGTDKLSLNTIKEPKLFTEITSEKSIDVGENSSIRKDTTMSLLPEYSVNIQNNKRLKEDENILSKENKQTMTTEVMYKSPVLNEQTFFKMFTTSSTKENVKSSHGSKDENTNVRQTVVISKSNKGFTLPQSNDGSNISIFSNTDSADSNNLNLKSITKVQKPNMVTTASIKPSLMNMNEENNNKNITFSKDFNKTSSKTLDEQIGSKSNLFSVTDISWTVDKSLHDTIKAHDIDNLSENLIYTNQITTNSFQNKSSKETFKNEEEKESLTSLDIENYDKILSLQESDRKLLIETSTLQQTSSDSLSVMLHENREFPDLSTNTNSALESLNTITDDTFKPSQMRNEQETSAIYSITSGVGFVKKESSKLKKFNVQFTHKDNTDFTPSNNVNFTSAIGKILHGPQEFSNLLTEHYSPLSLQTTFGNYSTINDVTQSQSITSISSKQKQLVEEKSQEIQFTATPYAITGLGDLPENYSPSSLPTTLDNYSTINDDTQSMTSLTSKPMQLVEEIPQDTQVTATPYAITGLGDLPENYSPSSLQTTLGNNSKINDDTQSMTPLTSKPMQLVEEISQDTQVTATAYAITGLGDLPENYSPSSLPTTLGNYSTINDDTQSITPISTKPMQLVEEISKDTQVRATPYAFTGLGNVQSNSILYVENTKTEIDMTLAKTTTENFTARSASTSTLKHDDATPSLSLDEATLKLPQTNRSGVPGRLVTSEILYPNITERIKNKSSTGKQKKPPNTKIDSFKLLFPETEHSTNKTHKNMTIDMDLPKYSEILTQTYELSTVTETKDENTESVSRHTDKKWSTNHTILDISTNYETTLKAYNVSNLTALMNMTKRFMHNLPYNMKSAEIKQNDNNNTNLTKLRESGSLSTSTISSILKNMLKKLNQSSSGRISPDKQNNTGQDKMRNRFVIENITKKTVLKIEKPVYDLIGKIFFNSNNSIIKKLSNTDKNKKGYTQLNSSIKISTDSTKHLSNEDLFSLKDLMEQTKNISGVMSKKDHTTLHYPQYTLSYPSKIAPILMSRIATATDKPSPLNRRTYLFRKYDNNMLVTSYKPISTHMTQTVTSSAQTTKTIKYNTYKPTTEDLDNTLSLEARIKLFKENLPKSKYTTIKGSQVGIKIKNTPACELLRNLSHHVDPSLKSFIELVKASNCSEELTPTSSINPPVKVKVRRNKILTKNFVSLNPNLTKVKLLDPFVKTNLYPIKIVSPKTQRKIMRRIHLASKNKEIMTMNTGDFFSQRRFMTQKNVNAARKFRPDTMNMRVYKPTSVPRQVVLRPKFEQERTNLRPKPLIYQNKDNFFRDEYQNQRRAFSWRDNYIQKVLKKKQPAVPKYNVLARPFVLEPSTKPKVLRDRVDSIRNYLINTDFVKSTTQRDFFLDSPLDDSDGLGDDDDGEDDEMPQQLLPLKRNFWIPEEVKTTTTKRPRRTRPRRTIFFLSPTVPYNRYF